MAADAAGMIGASGTFTLRDVTVPAVALADGSLSADGLLRMDISVRDGRIAAVSVAAPVMPGEATLGGRMVLPAFVDCHTHLDKGHIWPRSPNPDGSFVGALTSVSTDRAANWSARDVETRMEFALRCAHAHGTKAIRTHLDSIAPQETISWPVFEAVRERWSGRIALQASSLIGIEQARDAAWLESLAVRVRAVGGVFGAVTYPVPDVVELIDRLFTVAARHGLELDFHADETQDTASQTLRLIAEAAIRHRHDGPILIGHCCSLARQPDGEVMRTLDRVAETSISVVSLPMCNMYLQDRRADGTTPRFRGVTLMHELKARGINVCVASDNTRDPFYAYGDLDMLEVYRMATRIIQFDHPVGDWPKTVLANPARAMGLGAGYGTLAVGDPADLVLLRGRDWSEALSRSESGRIVIRHGQRIDTALPDYAELDHLWETA